MKFIKIYSFLLLLKTCMYLHYHFQCFYVICIARFGSTVSMLNVVMVLACWVSMLSCMYVCFGSGTRMNGTWCVWVNGGASVVCSAIDSKCSSQYFNGPG